MAGWFVFFSFRPPDLMGIASVWPSTILPLHSFHIPKNTYFRPAFEQMTLITPHSSHFFPPKS